MNFLTMQQELSDRLGVYDQTVSTDATKLKRWLNMAQQDVCAKKNWPFMVGHEIIQTVTDYTTGTCSVSAAGSTVTFSGTITDSKTNFFIKFSSADDWYKITAHTAGASTATITPSYGQTTDLTAGTFTIRKLWYYTSTPFDSILDIKKTVSGRRLESVNVRESDMFLPLYLSSGTPYQYILSIPDTTSGLALSFLYSPDTAINLQVRGIKKLSDLSSDSDTSIIPARWHSAVIDMASFYGFSSVDDTRAADFYKRAEIGIDDMSRVFSQDLGRHRIMRPIDAQNNVGPVYSWPSNFGPEWP